MSASKRALDVIGSAIALVLTAPLFLVIAAAIKLDDGGPVLFRQVRVGFRGREFRIIKFRTMRVAQAAAIAVTVAGDSRVTRLGGWLRRFKLDELPQLLQVLRGEMSLVGPRPEVPAYAARCPAELRAVFDHHPGLTDPASVEGWDEGEVLARSSDPEKTYLEEVMPAKVRRQLAYARRATLRSDLRVLLATMGHPWDAWAPVLVAKMVRHRRAIIVSTHVALVLLSFLSAYALRFDFTIPVEERWAMLVSLPILLAVRLATLARFGLYSGFWKHFGVEDLVQLVVAVTMGSVAFLAILVGLRGAIIIPRSVLVLDWFGVIFLVGAAHLVARSLREGRLRLLPRPGQRTFVVGSGDNAERFLREIVRSSQRTVDVVGVVSNQASNRGRSVHGIPVVGATVDLSALVSHYDIGLVIIAVENTTGAQVERIIESCAASSVDFRILPSLDEQLSGRVNPAQLRRVKLEDLLGRDPVSLDMATIRADLAGRRVLVTGGAGSIGSELARQIAGYGPASLVLLDRAESDLYFTHLDLLRAYPGVDVKAIICDVTDSARLIKVFDAHRPDFVFHAAAYKHVPLMEANPIEAVQNNVLGTMVVANAAATFGARKFVLISTDKAVNPSSVMGATKRIAERVVLGLPALRRSVTDFRAVRFGNVLGSAGSVIPLFERQLAAGDPLTVTHPDAERYFMTIPEAVQLVLQAGTMPQARGRICMLDMGEPVRIVDLARKMLSLSGVKPRIGVSLVFTGLRPGEKLREDLVSSTEASVTTEIPKIRLVQSMTEAGVDVADLVDRLLRAMRLGDDAHLLQELAAVVPEYRIAGPVAVVAPVNGHSGDVAGTAAAEASL